MRHEKAGLYFPTFHWSNPDSAGPLAEAMTRAVKTGDYKGIHSIIISKGGKTLYEQLFERISCSDSLHDSRSFFKSVTSLLVGIAIDRGLLKSVDEPAYKFFPNDTAFATDPRKKAMTIKDLLQMRSGFDCDE